METSIDSALGAVVADAGIPVHTKCVAAAVAYTFITELASDSGSIKGAILRWLAGELNDWRKKHCT